MATFTGTIPTFAGGDNATVVANLNLFRDALKAANDPWTSYGSAASWTSSATNPVLGNGTWSGWYLQLGKLVVFSVRITTGGTTTYGTGSYRVALPVAMHAHHPGRFQVALLDTSAGNTYHGVTYSVSGSTAPIAIDNGTAGGALAGVGASTPFTFATGDVIDVSGTYEAA